MSAFRLAMSAAFTDRMARPAELIREVGSLAMVVRKEGILGLENHQTDNEFLQKAINLCVDGHPPELVEEALAQETSRPPNGTKWPSGCSGASANRLRPLACWAPS